MDAHISCEPEDYVAELERSEKSLRQADQRKNEFLATLAHELRNPLAAISNALQAWPSVEHDRAQVERLREIMRRQLRQALRLSDDLLDVGRIAQGKIELRRQDVEIRSLLEGALEEVAPLIESCGHHLSVSLPAEPLRVDGDPCRLLQVLANLIQNAAKYTPRNGRIEVSAELEDGMAVVRVGDNGQGIAEQMLSAIFEVFTQVGEPSAESPGGLGIGLSLVKSIVELHGGSVAARSEGLGHGSEFIVRLTALSEPTHPVPRSVPAPAVVVVKPPLAHRILVVDDVRASSQTLALMLRAIGQDVQVAGNGAAAIGNVLSDHPDVVFLDLLMPGMGGFEVARRLRVHTELANLVLVAVTGDGEAESQRQAFVSGFNHYLVKPVSLTDLELLLAGIPAADQCRADCRRLSEAGSAPGQAEQASRDGRNRVD